MLRRLALLLCCVPPAHAVVVRGYVRTALGRPVAGARVQLILGQRSVADDISGVDGSYELKAAAAGRFVLLTSSSMLASRPAIAIGTLFYAGRTDLVMREIVLDPLFVAPRESALLTLLPTQPGLLGGIVHPVAADRLLPHTTVLPEVSRLPGAFFVQHGSFGTPASLYLRGAGPAFTQVLVDDLPAEDLGGGFNLSSLGTAGIAAFAPAPALELAAGAVPLRGVDAAAGILAATTQPVHSLRPSLTYAGDAGNLASVRQQGTGSLTLLRADLVGDYARMDTDSGDPALRAHLGSASARAGYFVSAGTGLHASLHEDVLAAPLAVPSLLYAASPTGRQGERNLYGTGIFETRGARGWHIAAGYGLVRRRGQTLVFTQPVQAQGVTVRGANGSSAIGIPVLPSLPAREDAVTNRDSFYLQADSPVRSWLSAVGTVRYLDERAADLLPGVRATLRRQHLSFAGGVQGSLLRQRLAYEAAGLVDRAHPFGVLGAPRFGLTFTPVFEGARRLRGTTLHATAATGFREPSLREQASAATLEPPRTRTVSAGVDQTVLPGKLMLHVTWFHTQVSHDFEPAGRTTYIQTYSQTLAYRAQGVESMLHFQPFSRVSVDGAYTYVAALVERSASAPGFNPTAPATPIGVQSALAGARPFHRPPHSGSFSVAYTGNRFAASLNGAIASRSDSSTGEGFFAPAGPTLLLPNRDLSPGYTALDAYASYVLSRHVTAYTQLTNLLDDRGLVPLGYRAMPLLVRSGLRLRLGGD